MKRFHPRDYAPLWVMLACAAVCGVLLLSGVIDIASLPALVRGRPLAALAVVVALFIVKGFSGVVLYNPLIIAVALIYPLPVALAVNAAGTVLTLAISYEIGRHTKTTNLEGMLDKHTKLKKYFRATQTYGFVACFAIHTIGLSMEVLGILFGMLRIGFWRYLVSSWLAILPGMICFTIVGSELDFRSPVFWAVLAADAVMIAFGAIYTRRKLTGGAADAAASGDASAHTPKNPPDAG